MAELRLPFGARLQLLDGETVLFTTRRHVATVVVPVVVIGIAGLILLVEGCPAAVELALDGRCPLVVSAGVVAASLPFVLDWFATRFILTSQRLIIVRAPVWFRTASLRLEEIESLSLRAGIPGRVLNFGDVIADSAATGAGRITLDFVPDPEAIRDRIATAIAGRVR